MKIYHKLVSIFLICALIVSCAGNDTDIEAIYEEAFVLSDNQKYAEAIEHLERNIQPRNRKGRFYFLVGNLYTVLNAKYFKEIAVENYLKAEEYEPENFRIIEAIGSSYLVLERYAEALSYLEKAVKLYDSTFPQLLEPYGTLASTYYGLGRYDEALEAIDQSLQINPDDVWYILLRGIILSQSGDVEVLTRHYQLAHEKEPNDSSISEQYGFRLMEMKEFEKAREFYESLLATDGTNGPSWVRAEIGFIELLEDNPEEAKRQLDIAYNLEVRRVTVLKYLSFWHYTQGNDQEAIAKFVHYHRATTVNKPIDSEMSIEDFEEYHKDDQLFQLLREIYKR